MTITIDDSTPISSTDLTVLPEPNDEPKITNNSLKDIIDWLDSGDLIILFCGNHKLRYRIVNKEPHRKIFVELTGPGLLSEGEWPWYIENAGATLQPNEDGMFKSEYSFRLDTFC